MSRELATTVNVCRDSEWSTENSSSNFSLAHQIAKTGAMNYSIAMNSSTIIQRAHRKRQMTINYPQSGGNGILKEWNETMAKIEYRTVIRFESEFQTLNVSSLSSNEQMQLLPESFLQS